MVEKKSDWHLSASAGSSSPCTLPATDPFITNSLHADDDSSHAMSDTSEGTSEDTSEAYADENPADTNTLDRDPADETASETDSEKTHVINDRTETVPYSPPPNSPAGVAAILAERHAGNNTKRGTIGDLIAIDSSFREDIRTSDDTETQRQDTSLADVLSEKPRPDISMTEDELAWIDDVYQLDPEDEIGILICLLRITPERLRNTQLYALLVASCRMFLSIYMNFGYHEYLGNQNITFEDVHFINEEYADLLDAENIEEEIWQI